MNVFGQAALRLLLPLCLIAAPLAFGACSGESDGRGDDELPWWEGGQRPHARPDDLPLPAGATVPIPGGPAGPVATYESPRTALDQCAVGFGLPEMCNGRDDDCDGLIDEGCAFTWLNFSATAAEIEGLPSVDYHADTRAGSLQVDFNGGYRAAMDPADPSFDAAMVILRNGAGQVVEALQLNRGFVPYQLDEEGFQLADPPPVRWLWGPELGEQSVSLPYRTRGSNEGFDLSGRRVSVMARAEISTGAEPPVDNRHQFVVFAWHAPRGIQSARLQLRARYDWNGDGLDDGDTWVPIYRYAWRGDGDDLVEWPIEWVKATENVVTLRINVQDAHDFVRLRYDEQNYFSPATLPPELD